jgi:hypothetical protein
MITIKDLLEARTDTVVMAFGRLNPPTSGHAVLANAIMTLSKKHNADHVFYLSRTQDAKKNPLTVDQKVYYARQAFKGMNIIGASDKIRTIMEAAKSLSGKYKNLIVVAGSDRVLEFKTLLDKYNGKDYNFQTILVISAGERDPDADGAQGMSATKMRQAAAENDFNKFKTGCPPGMSAVVCKKMFDDIRTGMKISEGTDDVREDYVNERIFNIGDIVSYNEQELAITFRGSNYVVLENNEKAWLKDIKPTEKVNEAIMVKQQDKLRAARIIGMALGYDEAESKTDPVQIVNTALRIIRNKPLSAEAKKILIRMLELATKMEIKYDEKLLHLKEEVVSEVSDTTLKSYTKKAMQDTLSGKKDRNKGMQKAYSKLAGTDKPLMGEARDNAHTDNEEAETHHLMVKQGAASETSYKRMRKIMLKVHESDENEEDISDDELDDIVNSFSEDDIIEHGYEDEEFMVHDDDGNILEDAEVQAELDTIQEVLSRVERLKSKVRMLRSKAKRERGARIALHKRSSTKVLSGRAKRLAIKAIKQRFAKKPLNQLSVAEKERLEQRVARMKPILTRLAMKMLPRVRQIEKDRLTSQHTKS